MTDARRRRPDTISEPPILFAAVVLATVAAGRVMPFAGRRDRPRRSPQGDR